DPKAINPLPLAAELNTVSALTETTSSVLEKVQAPGSQGKDSFHANMNLSSDIGITEATVKTNPPPYNLLMPQLQNYENDTRKIVVPPTLSTANNLTAADNALLEQDSQQSAEKMSVIPNPQEHIAATPWDAESASKPDKNSGKHRIRMDLMAKTMGDQANQNSGVQTVGDAKKIMEIESHRLVNSKIPADNLLMDETAQEAGAEELKTLTNVDKILAELAKPSSETAKPQAANRGYTTVNPEEIAEQIVKKVEIMAKQASSEMKIQLKPEYLGKMMIQIIVDDGVITARFTTESQQVKQALESNMSILKQNLEANGMRVEKTEVNVQLDNGGNSNNGSEGNRQYLWQEMTGQGRDSNQYVQYNRDYFDDMPDLTPYQQGTDIPQLMHEGRLDFTI
ncbi:MAG: flagellar hook-length control protein FliK, partial [Syntrophomonas sp.]|nr:flagellar hook-length control protein FliK [Syntrophomonas sp.]